MPLIIGSGHLRHGAEQGGRRVNRSSGTGVFFAVGVPDVSRLTGPDGRLPAGSQLLVVLTVAVIRQIRPEAVSTQAETVAGNGGTCKNACFPASPTLRG